MSTATGVVEKIHKNSKAYNVVVDGEWYGYGWLTDGPPAFNEGDNISFSFEKKGKYSQMDKASVKIVPSTKSKSGGGGSDARQLAIQYQASRNAAIDTLGILISAGAIALPAKKQDQYDAALAIIDDLTKKYHNDVDLVVENGGLVLDDESAFAPPVDDDFQS